MKAPLTALALCIGAGALCAALNLPLPWMIGPLLAMAAARFFGIDVAAPPLAREGGQLIIATALGLYFTPSVAREVVGLIGWIIAAGLFAIAVGLVSSRIAQALMRGALSPATAFFASVPGGATEMAVLAERAGGRVDQVAFAQSFRILVVVLTIPFIYTYGGIHGLDRYAPVAVPVSAPSLLLLFALTALGGFVLTVLKRPNPFMLGPLFVAIGMTASGVELSAMPAPLSAAGQLLLGCALGAKFEQSFFRTAPRFMGAMLAATVTAMLFTSAFAWFVIGKLGGVPVATGVLAVAPGGIAEMCITAKTLQLGVPVVTAFHVGRVIILVLLADLAYRFSSRLSGRGRG